jgi:type III secretion protein V
VVVRIDLTRTLPLLARVRGAAEVLPGLAVVGIVALLFVPVGPAALDALLAASLGIAAAVLLASLLAPDALQLSAFPALLLLTTVFRLALAVSSTRLVLTRGEAGRVIEALGAVVVQGSWVAGAVIYAIVALVQLLVVSRGAERVAEVSARCTLDALPGKQMAIDAELRAGSIDAAEAARRRSALERESHLHGAMDGALKFVKGDALAGVAIAVVNALGGLATGALRGMPLPAAARRYVLLAVGDGLASQIPGLLLAVAAGVAVTRVAGTRRSLGAEVAREIASEPRALMASAGLLAALAVAPGLPALPFAALSLGVGSAGLAARRRARRPDPPDPAPGTQAAPASAPAVVRISRHALAGAAGGASRIEDASRALRADLWSWLGVPVPTVTVTAEELPEGAWVVEVEGAPSAAGRLPPDRALCLAPPEEVRLAGIPAAPARHPLGGGAASAIPRESEPRAAALAPVLDPLAWTLAAAAAGLRRSAHLLVGVQEVQALLDGLESEAPALVREAARQLPPALVAEVLRRLLEEEVSVRPLRTILQSMLAHGPAPGSQVLAEGCRRALARHIAHRVAGSQELAAVLLDPGAECLLRESLAGEVVAVSGPQLSALLDSLDDAVAGDPRPTALLAAADVRRPLRNLVAARFPGLAVLAYEELPPDLRIRPVGRACFPG